MRYQDAIVTFTQEAVRQFYRYARAVPTDRLDWIPAEGGRSVIDMAREVAISPEWALAVFTGVEMSAEQIDAQQRDMASWETVERCEEMCFRKLTPWLELLQWLSDAQLSETKWLPYEGGRDFTYLEMTDYPRWNANYHTGQVAYLQRLYGDLENY